MDNYGRIFYIDHKNHTTTWKKPTVGSTPTLESTSNQILNTNETQVGKIKHQQVISRVFIVSLFLFLQELYFAFTIFFIEFFAGTTTTR